MSYTNKFFVDSCIFIENFKRNEIPEAKAIWNEILRNFKENDFFVNLIVKNEVVYHLFVKKKLMTIKELKLLLNSFENLFITPEIEKDLFKIVEKHNLKPNDALILATCKHYGIKYLISIDTDFPTPCQKEGIVLINSVEKLKEILEKQ